MGPKIDDLDSHMSDLTLFSTWDGPRTNYGTVPAKANEDIATFYEGTQGYRTNDLALLQSFMKIPSVPEYIGSGIATGTNAFWIVLQCRSESDGRWKWLDGSETDFETRLACQPILDTCRAASFEFGKIGWWRESCSRRHGALCQLEAGTRPFSQGLSWTAHALRQRG